MKRAKWIVFAVTLAVAPALFAAESYRRCLDNCPVGNNRCSESPAMQTLLVFRLTVRVKLLAVGLLADLDAVVHAGLHGRPALPYTTTQIAGGCKR